MREVEKGKRERWTTKTERERESERDEMSDEMREEGSDEKR